MGKLSQEEIIEALSNLTVLEMSELKSALEEKWGVQAAAAAPAMVMAAPGEGGAAEAAEESTDFQVTLTEVPEKTIPVIKAIREVTGLGLKDAKDALAVPTVLKESAPKEEADEIVKKFEAAGAKVTLKGL